MESIKAWFMVDWIEIELAETNPSYNYEKKSLDLVVLF